MDLQDFVIKGITSQLRFSDLAPLFLDSRGGLIQDLAQRLETRDWGYSDDLVEVTKADRSATFRVTTRELRAAFENVSDVDAARDSTRWLFETLLERLDVEHIRTIGVRSWWLAPVDSFSDLNDWLLERLGASIDGLIEAVGSRPSDVGWVLDFAGDDAKPRHLVRIGPMKAEQAMAEYFADQNRGNYPDQFLFLDVDRIYSQDGRVSTDQALKRWESAFTRNVEVGKKITRTLNPTP